MKKNIKIILFLAAIFIVAFSFGQNRELNLLKKNVQLANIDSSKVIISQIDSKQLNLYQKADFAYWKANFYKLINDDDVAFENYLQSKKYYIELDSLLKVAKINIEITSLVLAMKDSKIDYHNFLSEFLKYAKTSNDKQLLSEGFMQLGKSLYDSNPNHAKQYFFKAYSYITS